MQCTKQTEHGTENTSVTSDTHCRVQEQKAVVRELTVILHLKSCGRIFKSFHRVSEDMHVTLHHKELVQVTEKLGQNPSDGTLPHL